jgi:serine/threonine-protein kinase
VDFGIAKAATQSTHTSVGVLKGKYTYMSPEQAQGDLVDARTDQFALGIVLWELLTMRRLFKRETEVLTLEAIINGQIPRVSRFREDIPKSIDDIVAKALSKDRNARFASCEQLALSLEDALSAEGVVHSQSRLSQYMRRLFADTLAEEATLGLVNPDGSLSRNLTPFTLPPQPANDAGAFEKIAEKPAAPPIDATTADRKIARSKAESSKDETSSKKKHVDSAAEKKIEPAPSPTSKASASNTEPTVVEEPRRKPRAPSPDTPETPKPKERSRSTPRSPPRAEPRARPRAAIYIAGVAGAVALFVASAAGYAAYATSGPATLVVRSEPHGASVSIDGKSTGQVTPALLRDVDAGTPHRIHIELAGKQSDEVVTIPKRGATLEIKLELR